MELYDKAPPTTLTTTQWHGSVKMSLIRCTLLAALWTLATCDEPCADEWNSNLKRLNTELNCNYNTDHRPVIDHEKTVQVQIGLTLRYYTFDPLEESLSVHSSIAMKWRDEYMQWEPSDFGNITSINVASTTIWKPSVELFNSVGDTDIEWGICNLTYKGQVSCTPDLAQTALCASDLRAWPYDTLTCTLYYGTWINTGEQVNYTHPDDGASPISFDDCKNGPGWSLLDAQSTWLPNVLMNSSFPVIKYELKFRREAAAEACGASGVGVAVVLLPLAAALGGGARLPLALAGVAAHMVALRELSRSVPRHGARSPRLLLACRSSLLIACAGVLAALLLAWLRARPASTQPPPRALATLVRIASTTPVNHFVFADLDSERQTLTQDEINPESPWLAFANLLDAALCIIALIIYAVIVFA